MKRQLVRASIVAIGAMRDVNPRLHFCHIDPVINVLPKRPGLAREASTYHLSQFEACDMILGRREPDLGGGTYRLPKHKSRTPDANAPAL